MKKPEAPLDLRVIRISLSSRYALEAMASLARRRGFCMTAEVARRNGLPGNFLAKIFHKLAARGLLAARRGPGGGYRLARRPKDIRVAEIIGCVAEAGPEERPCLLGMGACGSHRPCPAHKAVLEAEALLRRALDHLSLAELVEAKRRG